MRLKIISTLKENAHKNRFTRKPGKIDFFLKNGCSIKIIDFENIGIL